MSLPVQSKSTQTLTIKRLKARASASAQYRKRKAFINKYKEQPCADCRGTFPLCCMDFDHVRGEKKFNFGGGKMGMPSFSIIEEEIAKCDVVCANCHRIRTEQRGYTN